MIVEDSYLAYLDSRHCTRSRTVVYHIATLPFFSLNLANKAAGIIDQGRKESMLLFGVGIQK